MKVRAVGAELFHADTRTEGWVDGRTVGHDEADSHLSQLCERAYKRLSKMSPARTRKACGCSGGKVSLILNFGTRLLASHHGQFNLRARSSVPIK